MKRAYSDGRGLLIVGLTSLRELMHVLAVGTKPFLNSKSNNNKKKNRFEQFVQQFEWVKPHVQHNLPTLHSIFFGLASFSLQRPLWEYMYHDIQ